MGLLLSFYLKGYLWSSIDLTFIQYLNFFPSNKVLVRNQPINVVRHVQIATIIRGTECVNNQCQTCGNVSSSESKMENTRSTSSTQTLDPKPPAEESTTVSTPTLSTAAATAAAAGCRPYDPEDCNDEFPRCNAILESDFCNNPLTGMWARRQCRKFCKFC